MRKFVSRPPTVDEAVKILGWPHNTLEYRRSCLSLWADMGADVKTIKEKFSVEWKKRKQ